MTTTGFTQPSLANKPSSHLDTSVEKTTPVRFWPWKAALLLLLLMGSAMRIAQYAARTSFWHDEAFIVLNIRDLTCRQLVGKLEYYSAAPPLFLMALRASALIGGVNEYAVRLVPLLGGLAGLLVFWSLCRRVLPMPAALFSFGLFALYRRLVEYSAEAKQYTLDATVSALLLLIAFGGRGSPLRRLAWVSLASAVLLWLSHPVVFVFGGISLALSLQCLKRGRREALLAIALNVMVVASFGALYLVSIRYQHSDFLDSPTQWGGDFADLHHPAGLPRWCAVKFFEFVQAPYRWGGPFFIALMIVAFAWGRRRSDLAIWSACALSILLTMTAGLIGQYPFDGSRLTLFLAPQLFLLVGAGSARLWEMLPSPWRPAWWILPAALCGHALALGIGRLVHPHYESNIRPAVEFCRAHRTDDESLVLIGQHWTGDAQGNRFSGRHVEALCYWPHPAGKIHTRFSRWEEIGERRFWILSTFDPNGHAERRALENLRAELRGIADEKAAYINEHGGAAILYERHASASAIPRQLD